jgi:hypothetical protein
LVCNWKDFGTDLHLHVCRMVQHKLTCYTINRDGTDGCQVCFVAKEYVAGDNSHCLDGAIVQIMGVFKPDDKNLSMQCLCHHNHGYAYAIVCVFN